MLLTNQKIRIAEFYFPVLAIIIAIAFCLRISLMLYIGMDEPRLVYTFDSDGYVDLAETISNHGQFSRDEEPPFTAELVRTPVYPFVISVIVGIFDNEMPVILLQVLLGCATIVFSYLLVVTLGFSYQAANWTAIILAVEPITIMLGNRLLTETLFNCLLMAGLWLFVRGWRNPSLPGLALAAVFMGLAALCRPIAQFLPIFLVLLLALSWNRESWRPRVVRIVLFFTLSSAVMGFWAYRNHQVGDAFVVSKVAHQNLLFYRARAVLAAGEDMTQDMAREQLRNEIHERFGPNPNMAHPDVVKYTQSRALGIFAQFPGLTFQMLGKGVFRMMVDPGYTITCTLLDKSSTNFDCFPGEATMLGDDLLSQAWERFTQMNLVQQFTLVWSTLLLAIVYLLALLGVIALIRDRRYLSLSLLMCLIAYFTLLSAGSEANYRFRAPIIPAIAILAGVGCSGGLAIFGFVSTRRVLIDKNVPPD